MTSYIRTEILRVLHASHPIALPEARLLTAMRLAGFADFDHRSLLSHLDALAELMQITVEADPLAEERRLWKLSERGRVTLAKTGLIPGN